MSSGLQEKINDLNCTERRLKAEYNNCQLDVLCYGLAIEKLEKKLSKKQKKIKKLNKKSMKETFHDMQSLMFETNRLSNDVEKAVAKRLTKIDAMDEKHSELSAVSNELNVLLKWSNRKDESMEEK